MSRSHHERWPWVITVILAWIVMIVFLAIHDMKQQEKVRPAGEAWKPPNIEQCDKSLWDRIREGCDEVD